MKEKGPGDFGSEMARMLPLLLRTITRRQESIFAKGKLTLPHVVILEILREKGPCKMGDLARTLNFTMSAVTSIVDKMVKLGLVKRERSRKDRRVVRVSLVKKGEETAKKVVNERKHMASEMFSVLTEAERKEYLRMFGKVYEHLRKGL
jgi:DNA-binding MarR family transcriptional regulator